MVNQTFDSASGTGASDYTTQSSVENSLGGFHDRAKTAVWRVWAVARIAICKLSCLLHPSTDRDIVGISSSGSICFIKRAQSTQR